MISGLEGPWLLCAALLLLTLAVWRGPGPNVSELSLMAAVTIGAAAARLAFGIWGPLHVNGHAPLWIQGALDPTRLAGYGPGYFELFSWVARLGVEPDRAIFAANALLSAFSPALLYAAARLTGVENGAALAVSVVLAADPVTVRTAASEGYFSSIIFLVLAVEATLALTVRAQLRGDPFGAGLAIGAACLLAAAAARVQPVGYLPLALCPLVVLGVAQPDRWRRRVTRAAVAGAAIGATVLLTTGQTIVTVLRAQPMAASAVNSAVPQGGRLLLVALGGAAGSLAMAWCFRRGMGLRWLPLLGIFSLILMLVTENTFHQSERWELCYQRLFWPGILLGATPLLPRHMQGLRWALGSAAVLVAALLVSSLPHLVSPTTEQLEYHFLREALRDMPPACTLASVTSARQRAWDIPAYLIPSRGPAQASFLNVERASDLSDAAASNDCLVYVRSSLCSSAEARALCESVEQEAPLTQVTSRVFPAAPTQTDLPYDRPEVEVVVFRLTSTGPERGAPITPAFAQALYDRLTPLRESDGCHVVRLDTSRFSITVGLQVPSGEEQTFELAHAPRGTTGRSAGGWTLAVSPELERNCGVTLVSIERALKDIGKR